MRQKSTPFKTVKFQSNPVSFDLSTIDENESESTTETETTEEISTWDGRYDLVSLRVGGDLILEDCSMF